MPKKTRTNEIKLSMEFNPGMKKYEPVLPLRKARENVKKRIEKRDLIILIVMVILIAAFLIYKVIAY